MNGQLRCLGVLLLLAAACGDDVSPASSDGGSSGSVEGTTGGDGPVPAGSTTSGTSETAADASSSGDPTEADGSSTTEPAPQVEFARGIRLDRLTANQATQVELVAGGLEVAGEDYNTRVIAGRRTLIRGFWSLHATFEPREILGRLTIDYPDGTQLEQDFVQTVEGDSGDGAGSSSFQWLLEPEDVVPGMTYRARLYEMEGSTAGGDVSTPPPVAPLAGPGTLELYDVPLELKVVLVPVQHEFEGCTSTPDITDQDVQDMREQLEQNNAVQSALLTVREPMVYSETIGEMGGFSPMLAALAQLRAEDDPDANVYYYGLMDPCDGFPPGLLGQAIAIAGPPTMDNGQQRISTGRWNGSGAAAAETFVHEVGHTQGRRHVQCSGGEAGFDPTYPHAGGRIGVWGFGIYDFELRSPSGGRDYMTYCSNEWVSDFGWEQTMDVIEVLTSFDNQSSPADTGVVLAGMVHEDGSTQWWTQPGAIAPEAANATAHLSVAGGTLDVPASATVLPHATAATYVQIPFDARARAASAISLDKGALHLDVEPDRIRMIR